MKHKTYTMRVFSIFLVFAYLLCGGSSLVFAQQTTQQQPGRAGGVVTLTVTEVDGPAELLSSTEVERQRGIRLQSELWKPALPRTMLDSGDQLRTGPGASMKLQMHDGTVVTLSGDSTVVIEELRSARGQAPPTTQFLLEKGKISTQQTARILGQTNQIIRTENGSVNISLGEVEIWKPEPETREYALLAALSPGFPLVAKKPDKSENTYVTLNRGTLVVESFGKDKMITNSVLLPETCPGQDGIMLTLAEAKTQVTVSRLEEDNGYRVFSKDRELFHLLVGTEGTANKIDVATRNSEAEVDLEGITVADQRPDSRLIVLMNPLLTAGVKSSDVMVKLICDATESKGLNEVGIRGFGEYTVHTTSLGGRDTNRPMPSRGRMGVTPTPAPPMTPTERPEDEDEEEPTPTPTPEEVWAPPSGVPIPPWPPAPIPGPLTTNDPNVGTHNILNLQTLSCNSIANGSVPCGLGQCGTNQSCVSASFFWGWPPASIEGGAVYIFDEGTPPGPPTCTTLLYARYIVSEYMGDRVQVSHDGAGTITITFCGPTGVLCTGSYNYSVRVTDKDFGAISQCIPQTQFTVP